MKIKTLLGNAKRWTKGTYARNKRGADTLIMDDGYQHLALRRDTNILVLDAGAPFGNGYLLPRGRLRELFLEANIIVRRYFAACNVDQSRVQLRPSKCCRTQFTPIGRRRRFLAPPLTTSESLDPGFRRGDGHSNKSDPWIPANIMRGRRQKLNPGPRLAPG